MATTTTILSRAWPELHPARRPVRRRAAARHQRSNQWTARSGSSPTRQARTRERPAAPPPATHRCGRPRHGCPPTGELWWTAP
ncbi:proline-rich receptor-like protein kinase PERK12 [Iris pallida]|uniref:Proline-rich receptor-like protein kinase PERK12 n=1 Tax=Iris pallida TaxID=29817 RepID=A0AAX6EAU3_IRIPA|nr:proline-rich receptor-like protein kinase PERK12 [Iris pallida]